MPVLPAARQTDEITHCLEMFGTVAGSILGSVVGVAILFAEAEAIVATGGAALLALPAALGAAGMAVSGGGLAGGQLARGLETVLGGPWKTGVIESGSPDVLIGRLPAARTVVDAAASCGGLVGLYHVTSPHVAIAEGAKKILINNQNAARVTMKLVCGGEIKTGFDRVLLGGPTARVLPVAYDEAAFRSFLGSMFEGSFYLTLIGSALLGPEAVALFLGTYGLCYLGFELLGELGDALGPGWRDVLQGGFGVILTALPLLKGRPVEEVNRLEQNKPPEENKPPEQDKPSDGEEPPEENKPPEPPEENKPPEQKEPPKDDENQNDGENTERTPEEARRQELAKDPAHNGKITPKTLHEADVGLALEENGELPRPITRDPSGAAEFIDAEGKKWDIKSFDSRWPPRKGGFKLEKALDDINDEFENGENVIIDTTNLSESHKAELRHAIEDKGWSDRVKWYP